MTTLAMIFIFILWPAFVGWYGQKRGLELIEVVMIGMLPVMLFHALN